MATGSQPFRFFYCTACGHKLRFGADRCGSCRRPTPLSNRYATYGVALALIIALLIAVF